MPIKCDGTVDVAALNEYFHSSDTFATHLGITITEARLDFAAATMPLTLMHRNGMGNAHGGAIFSLVDMAFAAAAHTSGMFFVTAQCSINYLEAGRIGPLSAEAIKIRRGKKLGIYNVQVFDVDKTLIASASITGYNTGINIDALDKYRAEQKKC